MTTPAEPSSPAGGEAEGAEGEDPRAEPRARYGERLRAREADFATLEARDRSFSRARLTVFLATLIAVGTAWAELTPWWLLAPLVVAFIVLVAAHDRVLRRLTRARRAAAHYRDGLARLDDAWVGTGSEGREHDPGGEHPFAGDLDLFGEGSLFELLCRARTRAGEETLARWLCPAADAPLPELDALRIRQAAVAELRAKLDLRERLAVLGQEVRAELRPEALRHWGEGPGPFSPTRRRLLIAAGVALPLLGVASGFAWGFGYGPWALLGVLAIEGAVIRSQRSLLARVAGPVDRNVAELAILSQVLAAIEDLRPEHEGLQAIVEALGGGEGSGSRRASAAIARLRRLFGWYEAQRSPLFVPIALFLMWGPSFALAIEGWRAEHGPRIRAWLAAVGEFEALSSLASHHYENPDDPFPELVEDAGPSVLVGEALGHPLIPRASCVRNSLALGDPVRAYVVSGSNMSGKSTFLRTVGSNVVLALAGAPVRAKSLRLSPIRVGATLKIQDSLREGASRFWAELLRLRAVSELADAGPTLFLLDEIFHGTNSHDRRIGAEALLESLIERGAIGMMTTHDLALARAAEALAPRAANVHFSDEIVDGELIFDYAMRPGVVDKSNALELMRAVGLMPPAGEGEGDEEREGDGDGDGDEDGDASTLRP